MAKTQTSPSAYLNLIRSIGLSDFKVKYNASILGYFWTLAKPLMLFTILYLVFSQFLRFGAGIEFYATQLLLGVIVWNYFHESTTTAMRSLVDKGGLLRKIYFPREIIVLASSLTAFLTMLLNLAVIPVFMVIQGVPFRIEALWAIPLLLELFLFTTGLSLLLSALYVRFRDIGHIWEIGLQGLFYATPIIYAASLVPVQFQGIMMSSPMAQIVQDLRAAVISPSALTPNQVMGDLLGLIPYLIALVVVIIGVTYFKRSSRSFAEEV